MEIYIAIVLVVILGAFTQSSAGFGFSIITMSLFPLFYSVVDSMILVVFINFVAVTYVVVKYFKFIRFRLLIVPLLLSLVATYFGLVNIVSIDNDIFVRILGGALILLSIYFFFFSSKISIPANQWTASTAGIVTGLMNGFFSMPGPPAVLYYSAAIKDKKEYIATIQTLFLVNSILKSVFFITNYDVSADILKIIPIAVIAAIIGTLLGNKAFKKLSSENLKKVVYVVMVLAGIKYLLF